MQAIDDFVVEDAQVTDVEPILAMLKARPGGDNGRWMPTQGCQIYVARDEAGIAAWLMLRVDHDRATITADQLEGEWHDGRPTPRGVQAMRLLGRMLHEKADDADYDVYTVVSLSNERHASVLKKYYHYEPESTVYHRLRKGVRSWRS